MSAPGIASMKFAFWLVCVVVLLHCFMMPTAVTVMAERTYKAKRGVLKTGLKPKEAYVPMSTSKWSKRSLCGIECHAKEWCLTFNFDRSTEKCELFDEKVVVSNLISDESSTYFGKMGLPVGIATTTALTTVSTTPTTKTTTTTATTTTATTTAPTISDPKYDSCILLIGGTDLGSDAAPVEYYHPIEGAECNVETIGNMSTEGIRGYTYETSGCYLPTTKQVVVREKSQSNKPPMVYELKDGSANQLPLPYSSYTAGSTTSTIGPSKCLSCGGSATATGSVLVECYQFDPSLDASKWTPIAPMPYQRQFAASVSLTENDFYLIGGWNKGASNHLFRFVGGTWSVGKPMSTKRRRHAAAPLSSTEFIICGGRNAEGTLSSCEIYDTTLKNWRTTGSLKQARRGLALISFDGDIYALGGNDDVVFMKTVEKYDRPTGEWAMAKAIKHPRTYFVGVAV